MSDDAMDDGDGNATILTLFAQILIRVGFNMLRRKL
jgi:hypothetical protein